MLRHRRHGRCWHWHAVDSAASGVRLGGGALPGVRRLDLRRRGQADGNLWLGSWMSAGSVRTLGIRPGTKDDWCPGPEAVLSCILCDGLGRRGHIGLSVGGGGGGRCEAQDRVRVGSFCFWGLAPGVGSHTRRSETLPLGLKHHRPVLLPWFGSSSTHMYIHADLTRLPTP